MQVQVRPWGRFDMVSNNATVKILTIKQNERTSLQKHKLRSEKFICIRGMVEITYGDNPTSLFTTRLLVGDRIILEIGKGQLHRITGLGEHENMLIEISEGIFDENDIVRIEDDYGRN